MKNAIGAVMCAMLFILLVMFFTKLGESGKVEQDNQSIVKGKM